MPLFGKKQYATVRIRKRDIPDGLWVKCPKCAEIVYKKEIEAALQVCPHCQYHFQVTALERLAQLSEPGSFEEWDRDLESVDILNFANDGTYVKKLTENQQKTGYRDAVICGRARIGPHVVGLGIMDFAFLGASMGSVVGEKITRLIERCTANRLPLVIVCASGGARMYEGMFSLMQMAKTSGALARHADARLPYIAVLTHPTTAGVMASFATLGDIIVAEPGALIGFAGPRVIRETTQQELPEGFQTSEFLLKHGLIDLVVHRRDLKPTLIALLDYLTGSQALNPADPAPATTTAS